MNNKISNKLYYLLLTGLIIIILALFVFAAPPNGHDANQIDFSNPIVGNFLKIGDTSNAGHIQLLRNGVNYIETSATNGILAFRTGNEAEAMRIIANGNVGIGKTDPKAKLHVSGDTLIEGNLLGAAKDISGTPLRTVCGKTTPGNTPWFVYSVHGISIKIDISAAGFTETPIILSSVGGASSHWVLTGATSIYGIDGTSSPLPTKDNFRLYVIMKDNRALTPAQANSWKWYVNWCAIGK